MHRKLMVVAACAFALAHGGALAQTDEDTRPLEKRLHIDKSFRIDLSGDCAYNARVTGNIDPARGGTADAVKPNLVVNADLQCADEAALLLTETISPAVPMRRDELEKVLALRASLTSSGGSRACEYRPDFNLSNAGLDLRAVSARCPSPST